MKLASIRNPDGIWINTEAFREAGNNFMKKNYYCPDPWGSNDWFAFWKQERQRCLRGVTIGGATITGEHYFYLNYCPIQRVENTQARVSVKIEGFPDFWDGDYNYFWSRNIARDGVIKSTLESTKLIHEIEEEQNRVTTLPTLEKAKEMKAYLEGLQLEVKIVLDHLEGGYDLILGKARRKGYSYKNSAIAACNYVHRPKSYTMFMAYEKKYLYPKGIFNMSLNHINFINSYTAWIMPTDIINRQDHIKSSYIEYSKGIKLEKGFKSEIQAISFKDNPDAGRGKDARDIIGEEVGAWGVPGGLKASLSAMQPSVSAGNIKTGMITLFGTSGDVEGGTADFANMHGRPLANNFLPFIDVWGDTEDKIEGFFHPVNWNMEGFYDAEGNSDLKGAVRAEQATRENLIANGATSSELQSRMQEHPLNSSEAFAIISVNNFPVIELKSQLEKVKAKKLQSIKGTPVELYYEGKECKGKPILSGKANPIISYYDIPVDKRGCPVIYEFPINNPPRGLYKIGYDPIRQDKGTSLAGITVYKGVHVGSTYHSILVAEYIGRLETPDDIDRVAEMLADMYNTTIMHENEVTGVKNYFRRIKRLGLLAAQPDTVISKNIKKSTVARVFGCHMNEQLKDAGERYVKTWLLTILDYDEHGDPIRVIDRIFSTRLLEELIAYNRRGNFDLVSSLFMCMFQVQEEKLGTEYEEGKGNNKFKKLLEISNNMYQKKSKRNFL